MNPCLVCVAYDTLFRFVPSFVLACVCVCVCVIPGRPDGKKTKTKKIQMSTFCVTGDRKNVDAAVAMLKRLIAEGNSELLAANGHNTINNAPGGITNGLPGAVPGGIPGAVPGGIGPGGMVSANGAANGVVNGDRRVLAGGGGVGGVARGPVGGAGEVVQRLGRVGSDMSRSDGSPPTAPCRFVVLELRWAIWLAVGGCFCVVFFFG